GLIPKENKMGKQTAPANAGKAGNPAPTGSETEKDKGVPADLLKRAAEMPKGVTTEAFDPMEKIPELRVGKNFSEGMKIMGYFDGTQILASHKFKYSQEKD